MILYRALQGFIGGAMIPSVFAAAFTIFPPSKRAVVSPMIGLVATLAPTIGRRSRRLHSHAMSWHWLFLVNVPFGIVVTLAVWNLVDFDKPDLSLFSRFDWYGLFGMGAFLGALEYVLEEGPLDDWFEDEVIVVMTVWCWSSARSCSSGGPSRRRSRSSTSRRSRTATSPSAPCSPSSWASASTA